MILEIGVDADNEGPSEAPAGMLQEVREALPDASEGLTTLQEQGSENEVPPVQQGIVERQPAQQETEIERQPEPVACDEIQPNVPAASPMPTMEPRREGIANTESLPASAQLDHASALREEPQQSSEHQQVQEGNAQVQAERKTLKLSQEDTSDNARSAAHGGACPSSLHPEGGVGPRTKQPQGRAGPSTPVPEAGASPRSLYFHATPHPSSRHPLAAGVSSLQHGHAGAASSAQHRLATMGPSSIHPHENTRAEAGSAAGTTDGPAATGNLQATTQTSFNVPTSPVDMAQRAVENQRTLFLEIRWPHSPNTPISPYGDASGSRGATPEFQVSPNNIQGRAPRTPLRNVEHGEEQAKEEDDDQGASLPTPPSLPPRSQILRCPAPSPKTPYNTPMRLHFEDCTTNDDTAQETYSQPLAPDSERPQSEREAEHPFHKPEHQRLEPERLRLEPEQEQPETEESEEKKTEDPGDRCKPHEHQKNIDDDDDNRDPEKDKLRIAHRGTRKSRKLSPKKDEQPRKRQSCVGGELDKVEEGDAVQNDEAYGRFGAEQSASEQSNGPATGEREVQELTPSKTPDRPRDYISPPGNPPVSRLELPEHIPEEPSPLGSGRRFQRSNMPPEYVPPRFDESDDSESSIAETDSSTDDSEAGSEEDSLTDDSEDEKGSLTSQEEAQEEERQPTDETISVTKSEQDKANPSSGTTTTVPNQRTLPSSPAIPPEPQTEGVRSRRRNRIERDEKRGTESLEIEAWIESPKLPKLRSYGNREVIRAEEILIYLASTEPPKGGATSRDLNQSLADIFRRQGAVELLAAGRNSVTMRLNGETNSSAMQGMNGNHNSMAMLLHDRVIHGATAGLNVNRNSVATEHLNGRSHAAERTNGSQRSTAAARERLNWRNPGA